MIFNWASFFDSIVCFSGDEEGNGRRGTGERTRPVPYLSAHILEVKESLEKSDSPETIQVMGVIVAGDLVSHPDFMSGRHRPWWLLVHLFLAPSRASLVSMPPGDRH